MKVFVTNFADFHPQLLRMAAPKGDKNRYHSAMCLLFSRGIYLQWRKYYRSVILAAKRKQEGSHWSKITRAFLRREYCFNSLETLRKPRRRRKRGHGETKDLIGRTIAQHVRSMQNNNVKSPQFASSANRNRDGKLF